MQTIHTLSFLSLRELECILCPRWILRKQQNIKTQILSTDSHTQVGTDKSEPRSFGMRSSKPERQAMSVEERVWRVGKGGMKVTEVSVQLTA